MDTSFESSQIIDAVEILEDSDTINGCSHLRTQKETLMLTDYIIEKLNDAGLSVYAEEYNKIGSSVRMHLMICITEKNNTIGN